MAWKWNYDQKNESVDDHDDDDDEDTRRETWCDCNGLIWNLSPDCHMNSQFYYVFIFLWKWKLELWDCVSVVGRWLKQSRKWTCASLTLPKWMQNEISRILWTVWLNRYCWDELFDNNHIDLNLVEQWCHDSHPRRFAATGWHSAIAFGTPWTFRKDDSWMLSIPVLTRRPITLSAWKKTPTITVIIYFVLSGVVLHFGYLMSNVLSSA